MGRKANYEKKEPKKRQRGSQAFTTCGFDDREAPREFQHIGIDAFNRACDKFLREREPGYAGFRDQQYGRAMRGKKRDKGSVSSEQGKKSAKRWWEGGEG